MPTSILGFPTVILASIGGIELDVVLQESHRFPSDITQNPVEDGTVFSDHVVLLPFVLEMEGRVSEASLTPFGVLEQNRHIDAFQALVELNTRREPFTVVTGIQVYQNMIFEELNIDRVRRDGRSIRLQASLREIQIVGEAALTNRDRIAADVTHTALSSVSRGVVTKVPV